jgi:transposase InsO family protein
MGVNRSGYYKWRSRKGKLNRYEQNRLVLTQLLQKEHEKHKVMGYHSLSANIRKSTDIVFSDNLAHKCCKAAGIHSKTRTYRYRKPGEESLKYENLVRGHWNAARPLKLVVSDMTCIPHKGINYEWTLFLDTFNNEIIAHSFSSKCGDSKPYYTCLDILKRKVGKKKKQTAPVVLHTDQGAVYSSRAYEQAHKNYNIVRSMSRAGTPTDNPIIESLNGWIKEELFLDFNLKESDDIAGVLTRYVDYFNNHRPAAALGYKSPAQFKIEQGFI